jgi:rubredoxin
VSNLAPFFISDIIKRRVQSKKKVLITGYSKGAGMAPLAAVLLRNSNVIADEVHLYEPPRCGDVNFMLAYNLAFPRTIRYEYQDDLVPHTPPTAIEMALLDSSSAIAGILNLLYPDHDSWNYASVGKLLFVNWGPPTPQIVPDSDDLEKQRMQHLADDFAQSSLAPLQDHGLNGHLFDTLMQAFSCGCTYPTWVDDPTSYDRLAARGQQSKQVMPGTRSLDMTKYRCRVCSFIYDPAMGEPSLGIPPYTPFERLPESYKCPRCTEPKFGFEPLPSTDSPPPPGGRGGH